MLCIINFVFFSIISNSNSSREEVKVMELIVLIFEHWEFPVRWSILFGGFSFDSRIFHSYGDVIIAGKALQILTYARQSWSLSSEGSWTCHTCCDNRNPVYNNHLRGPRRRKNWWLIYKNYYYDKNVCVKITCKDVKLLANSKQILVNVFILM